MIGIRNGLLGAAELRWSARRHGQQLRRELRQHARGSAGAPHLERWPRSFGDGKNSRCGFAQPAAEAMILVVSRTGVMVVVRIGARLLRQVGENPPAGLGCGTGLARLSLSLEILVKLMKRWSRDPGQVERQKERGSTSQIGRPDRLKNSTAHVTTHVTKSASNRF